MKYAADANGDWLHIDLMRNTRRLNLVRSLPLGTNDILFAPVHESP
jgi:hypothetical protein